MNKPAWLLHYLVDGPDQHGSRLTVDGEYRALNEGEAFTIHSVPGRFVVTIPAPANAREIIFAPKLPRAPHDNAMLNFDMGAA